MEKIVIQPPFRFDSFFENQACYLHVSGAETTFNAAQEKVKIKSQESVLLKCGSYFTDWLQSSTSEKSKIFAIHLYPDVLRDLYSKELPAYIKQKSYKKGIQKITSDKIISKFIESLDFYFENPTLVNEDILELKVKELILILVQTKNAESIIQLVSELFTPKKISIKVVMENHIFSNLPISKLAELSGLSESSFKREFKNTFQQTPTRYINAQRLTRAKELLEISDLSISEITYEQCQ
ncbi:MAG: helix-turn-helix transcriptional regulator [Flavobacteriales bacterium]|nr:helix-turn-helix transcriptional regulator [Flavobacteriales bacterium]